jgi:hypothetical protein
MGKNITCEKIQYNKRGLPVNSKGIDPKIRIFVQGQDLLKNNQSHVIDIPRIIS